MRYLVAYVDFLTMAAIALTRSVGCLMFRFKKEHLVENLFKPKVSCGVCVSLWIIAFAILSPITFSLQIGPYR